MRLIKELGVYQKEEEAEVRRVEKLKAEGAEGADIRQAENVLKEAQKMVPDAQQRMSGAVEDLRGVFDLAKDPSSPLPADDEMLLKAKEALEKAEA
ncbi:hypothetical protein M407DRAFT_175190 [Tulasnella calospora MUT 4182]|uniref:Tubulin-specific chaperone A n=1 Tax=Tulasnella calospora MUT 4182 TaxID=1051891 RepID=A0A0C3Q3H9_9AGAM|nr:hypothetical protein M407DRAFT_175190 [Tulasnella calospora MUT 4182]